MHPSGSGESESDTPSAIQHRVESWKDVARYIRYVVVGFPDKKMEADYIEARGTGVAIVWMFVGGLIACGHTLTLFRPYSIPWWLKMLDLMPWPLLITSIVACVCRLKKCFTGYANFLALLFALTILVQTVRIFLTATLTEHDNAPHLWFLPFFIVATTMRIFLARHAVFLGAIILGLQLNLPSLPSTVPIVGAFAIFMWCLLIISCFVHECFERYIFLVHNHLMEEVQARRVAEEVAVKQKAETLTTLAKLSHEIRTPLGCLLGLNDLLMSSTSEEERTGFAQAISSTGTHLLQLLNDILDYSKLRVGVVKLNECWSDLISTLTNCVDSFQSELVKKRIRLNLDIDDIRPNQLKFDPIRVRQICTNFMSNAIKFTPEDGCITFKVNFDVNAAQPHGRILELSITDTGVGMYTDQMNRLFDEFYQVDSTRSRSVGGAGLGLSITSDLAKAMGGTVGVDSVVNEGSTFWFKCFFSLRSNEAIPSTSIPLSTLNDGLPCTKGSHEAGGNASSTSIPSSTSNNSLPYIKGHRYVLSDHQQTNIPSNSSESQIRSPTLTVLLVDDTALNIIIYSAQLKRWGWSVITAENGETAISIMNQPHCNIDAIIMDVHMPEMDGLETSRIITGQHVSVPIFGLTADLTIDESLESFEASGMRALFYKPLTQQQTERIGTIIASNESALTPTTPGPPESCSVDLDDILLMSSLIPLETSPPA